MPDIVLLSKIYYSCDSFQGVQESLEVSKQALYFRLLDLLRMYFPNEKDKIRQAIKEYEGQQNTSIHNLFHNIKEQLIEEFNQYSPSLKTQIQDHIIDHGFVTSKELPALVNLNNWEELKKVLII